uniref:Uncharacterized protein n=1 Tax=Oryza sativa subsp. japonica TaxID=39947 RepID=Q94HN4_ORYSJ|nr:Hypothetical protein [Oryza sativa Japonica Group]
MTPIRTHPNSDTYQHDSQESCTQAAARFGFLPLDQMQSKWHVICINRGKETRKVKVSVIELWDAINPNVNKIISPQHDTD